jgi:hypothetical protein
LAHNPQELQEALAISLGRMLIAEPLEVAALASFFKAKVFAARHIQPP